MRLRLSTALSAFAFPKRHRPLVGADEKRDLVEAAASGDARAALKLLSMGCHPDSTSETPTGPVSALAAAAGFGSADVAKILLQAGANPNGIEGETPPIMVAAAKDDLEMCLALIGAGADPDLSDMEGGTALFRAAAEGRVETSRLLAEEGSEPCRPGPGGVTPEEIATKDCETAISAGLAIRRIRHEASVLAILVANPAGPEIGRARRI